MFKKLPPSRPRGKPRNAGVRLTIYRHHRTQTHCRIALGEDALKESGFIGGDRVDILLGEGEDTGSIAVTRGTEHALVQAGKQLYLSTPLYRFPNPIPVDRADCDWRWDGKMIVIDLPRRRPSDDI